MKRFITIGAASSRRVDFWGKALAKVDHQIIPYDQVLSGLPPIEDQTSLRITSPGEDFELFKYILELGNHPDIHSLQDLRGVINPNQNWYIGYSKLLLKINQWLKSIPELKAMNNPESILLSFHKMKCQKLLAQHLSVPEIFIEHLTSYNELIAYLEQQMIHEVFIKPYHGSSSSGVMALRQAKGKQIMYTTIQLTEKGLFNSLKLRKYNKIEDIAQIINAMVPAGLMVEQWIKKKRHRLKSFDFRVVVIGGEASFCVPRMSSHFITNLHLGNEKGDIEEFEIVLGKAKIEEIKSIAIKAVNSIGGLFYAGVDVAITDNLTPYVIEVNAFGDMLLGVHYNGSSTYECELKKWLELNS